MFAFFLPSVLLSRAGRRPKRTLADIAKPGRRDAGQVLANGGAAAAAAVLAASTHAPWAAAAFAGALAAASADTWGTEIGTLLGGRPRSIRTLAPMAAGLSGGITLAGTLAEAGGACAVAFAAWLVHLAAWWPVAAGGLGGALADSLLGATLQELRYCRACRRHCETDPHACGAPTILARGRAWFTNDLVNLAATLTGAVLAGAISSRL